MYRSVAILDLLERRRLGLAERALTGVMRAALPLGLRTRPVSLDRLPAAEPGGVYGLYLHVPFCETLCPYCSFHRVPFHSELAERYFDGLEAEMRMAAKMGYRCDTLYVGGGTPTVAVGRLIRVLDLARGLFGVRDVSCETHAHHLDPEIAGRLSGRVQRLSVGVQTLDADILRRMRREPDLFPPAKTLEAIRQMNGLFPTVNVDLIFNLPGQTRGGLRDDLDGVLRTGVRQVTTYPLMSSPGVSRRMERELGGRGGSREHEMFRLIEARMADEGMRASSPWCFSRPGEGLVDEYIVDAPEYLGLGSGAFSLLGGALYVNTFSLNLYAARIAAGRMSLERMRRFQPGELRHYRLMMGLFGLDPDRAATRPDEGEEGGWLREVEMFALRCAGAFSRNGEGKAVLNRNGRYLALAMMREFFAGMNRVRDELRAGLPEDDLIPLAAHGGEEHVCPAFQAV